MEPARRLDDLELARTLDMYRALVLWKSDGLTVEEATLRRMPSGTTLLGLVAHLAAVEEEWFAHVFAGEPMAEFDVDQSFAVAPDSSIDAVVGRYRAACDRSRRIAAEHDPDAVSALPHWFFGHATLRWIMFHMIRETAQHAGHMDILREMTDGRIGLVPPAATPASS